MICTYLYNKRVGPSFAHHFRGHSWTVLDRPEAVEDSATSLKEVAIKKIPNSWQNTTEVRCSEGPVIKLAVA